MDTAIPADMGQNNPMTHLHTVHIPGQRKIIHMNPLSSFFRASRLAARQWWQFIHCRITADIADEGQVGILQNPLYQRALGVPTVKEKQYLPVFQQGHHLLDEITG